MDVQYPLEPNHYLRRTTIQNHISVIVSNIPYHYKVIGDRYTSTKYTTYSCVVDIRMFRLTPVKGIKRYAKEVVYLLLSIEGDTTTKLLKMTTLLPKNNIELNYQEIIYVALL